MDIEPRCDDGTMPKDAMIRQWYDELKRATFLAHRPIAYNHATREMLASQGFIDIQEKTILIPLSTWPAVHTRQRDLANWYQMVLCKKDGFEGLEAYSLGPLTRPPCNWPKADVVGRCAQVDREIRNRKYHMYNNM